MRKIKVKFSDLEDTFEQGDYDHEFFLDTQTGHVIYLIDDIKSALNHLTGTAKTLEEKIAIIQASSEVSDWERDMYLDALHVIKDEDGRYLLIPRQDSREGYSDMEAFTETVDDDHLAAVLEKAIQGKGAFRRFKDALLHYPDQREAWFQFEKKCKVQRLKQWLASEGFEVDLE